jgi:DNA repair protein RadD
VRQQLRPYQARGLEQARVHVRNGVRRLVVIAPCGAGKTTIAAALIEGAVAKGKRILFIAHRKELIDQASARLDQFEIDHGVIMANHRRVKPSALVQVASVQTLVRRTVPEGVELVIVDEATTRAPTRTARSSRRARTPASSA